MEERLTLNQVGQVLAQRQQKSTDLLQEVGSLAHNIVSGASPAFASRRHKFLANITFASLTEIQGAHQSRVNAKRQLYGRLIDAGVPTEQLTSSYQEVTEENSLYLDPDAPELFLPESIYHSLIIIDDASRATLLLHLGSDLVKGIVRTIPYIDNQFLQTAVVVDGYYRTLILSELENYLDLARQQYINTDTKRGFNEARRKLTRFLKVDHPEGRARFVPVGAAVQLVLPGQTLGTSEFGLGYDLQAGVTKYIADLLVEKFENSMISRGLVQPSVVKKIRTERVASDREYYTPKGLKDTTLDVLRRIDLGKQDDLLKAYAESEIPGYFFSSTDKRVNPYNYGRLMPTDSLARKG